MSQGKADQEPRTLDDHFMRGWRVAMTHGRHPSFASWMEASSNSAYDAATRAMARGYGAGLLAADLLASRRGPFR